MSAHYRWCGEDLVLHCHLQPKASNDGIAGVLGDRLKIRITAPPVDGKANEHLIKWFSKLFRVPQSDIAILQGELGRQKTLLIKRPAQIPAIMGIHR